MTQHWLNSPMIRITAKELKVLDFDIENRPLSYWIPDRPSAEVTAIAWSWLGEEKVQHRLLLPPPDHDDSAMEMLDLFLLAYEEADMVTGHYIRKHDLPIINGALFEHGFRPLQEKLTSDTKLDLIKWKDLPASQENLAELYGLSHGKEHMSQAQWREGNRLTPYGLEETERRVVGDVVQHKELRERLIKDGALKPPRMWRP